MRIENKRERYDEFVDDLLELLPSHAAEVEDMDITPNLRAYQIADKQGSMVFWTTRVEERLIGYTTYWIADHPHHMGTTFATSDLLYVIPEWRGTAVPSIQMKTAELWLQDMGVDAIAYSLKAAHDHPELMENQGYHNTERVYTKVL
jgi:GNAT superfamily N-acetyltransferase